MSFLREVALMVPNLVDSARFISSFLLSTREVSVDLPSSVCPRFF